MSGKEATQDKVLRVSLTVEAYERLRKIARAEFRSPSQHIRFLVHQDIERGETTWSQ